ncbi:MAG: hypothetical protein HYZ61_01720 [Candidatus Andersenbacteria bacterium]|nr:hypothetical protein [Candidatus Andersenbacteria bacterium]
MADTKKTIIFLSAILLAVLVAGGAIIFLLPNGNTPVVNDNPTPTTTFGTGLDTSVLESSDYNQLDAALIQQGALPVKPPATTGKANPFL